MDAEKYPIPEALRIGRQMGDNHLLVSGGVLDQPLMLTEVMCARGIDAFMDRINIEGFKLSSLNKSEAELHEQITEITKEIATRV